MLLQKSKTLRSSNLSRCKIPITSRTHYSLIYGHVHVAYAPVDLRPLRQSSTDRRSSRVSKHLPTQLAWQTIWTVFLTLPIASQSLGETRRERKIPGSKPAWCAPQVGGTSDDFRLFRSRIVSRRWIAHHRRAPANYAPDASEPARAGKRGHPHSAGRFC